MSESEVSEIEVPSKSQIVKSDLEVSGREFLTFSIGNEQYGMDILSVQEIRSYEEPTRMANAPEYIKGVINLRGIIVPIIDMRIKFNLENVTYDESSVVIVLNIENKVLGMVVDGVSDVVSFTPEEMRPVPEFSSSVVSDYVIGLATLNDKMQILVDIKKLMSSAQMGLMD